MDRLMGVNVGARTDNRTARHPPRRARLVVGRAAAGRRRAGVAFAHEEHPAAVTRRRTPGRRGAGPPGRRCTPDWDGARMGSIPATDPVRAAPRCGHPRGRLSDPRFTVVDPPRSQVR
ncbi:hypothetical protein GCM10010286_32570 [Streptomyces toxytricini]|nr:hypothetical protein GCM10010286_32570 [Streptomyces toxytricini]